MVVKQDFINDLQELHQTRALQVKCDKFPPRRFEDPNKTILHFLIQSHRNLKDIFPGVTSDSFDRCATKEEFEDKLKV